MPTHTAVTPPTTADCPATGEPHRWRPLAKHGVPL